MPLLGQAAMLLNFDIEASAIAEHDDWHTHEHLPERLAIPGFLRGTRWVAMRGSPRYAVLYEVDRLETLQSAAYLDRLDHPTPWTAKMMPHYRDMRRGLCSVEGSWGRGLGGIALVIRFAHADSARPASLTQEILPGLAAGQGLCSVHLLRGALVAAMTAEQRIRGADAGVDGALLAMGYDFDAVTALESGALGVAAMHGRALSNVSTAVYRLACCLSADEVGA